MDWVYTIIVENHIEYCLIGVAISVDLIIFFLQGDGYHEANQRLSRSWLISGQTTSKKSIKVTPRLVVHVQIYSESACIVNGELYGKIGLRSP